MTNTFLSSRRHSGKSLIEALVIISLLSLVVGLSTTTLATLFRVRRQAQLDSEQRASLHRLAVRFRTDAHEAHSAQIAGGCEFTLPDGRKIQYAFASPNLTRQVLQNANILHHDTFRLSRAADVAFQQPQSENPLIRLSIRPIESRLPPRETPRMARIEAVVGLNSLGAQIARSP